jgi:hypothetical protein
MSHFERRFLSSFLRSLSQGAWLASVSLCRERRATGIFRGRGGSRRLLRGGSCHPWFTLLMPAKLHP